MRHASVRIALAFAVASAPAACGGDSTTGPPVTARVYVLQSLNGQPLPYLEFASGADTTVLLNESLSLRSDGKAVGYQTRRQVSGGVATITSTTPRYTYTLDAGQVVIAIDCPPGAMCVSPRTGWMSDAELVLGYGGTGPDAPTWRYTRALPD